MRMCSFLAQAYQHSMCQKRPCKCQKRPTNAMCSFLAQAYQHKGNLTIDKVCMCVCVCCMYIRICMYIRVGS
jgi:hypothetical protein